MNTTTTTPSVAVQIESAIASFDKIKTLMSRSADMIVKARRELFTAVSNLHALYQTQRAEVTAAMKPMGGYTQFAKTVIGPVADLVGDDAFELLAAIQNGLTLREYMTQGCTINLHELRKKNRKLRHMPDKTSAPVPEAREDAPIEEQLATAKARVSSLETTVKHLRDDVRHLRADNARICKSLKAYLAASLRAEQLSREAAEKY